MDTYLISMCIMGLAMCLLIYWVSVLHARVIKSADKHNGLVEVSAAVTGRIGQSLADLNTELRNAGVLPPMSEAEWGAKGERIASKIEAHMEKLREQGVGVGPASESRGTSMHRIKLPDGLTEKQCAELVDKHIADLSKAMGDDSVEIEHVNDVDDLPPEIRRLLDEDDEQQTKH
jgi:hypothetical protein